METIPHARRAVYYFVYNQARHMNHTRKRRDQTKDIVVLNIQYQRDLKKRIGLKPNPPGRPEYLAERPNDIFEESNVLVERPKQVSHQITQESSRRVQGHCQMIQGPSRRAQGFSRRPQGIRTHMI